jgi:hypothetical protein
MKLEFTGYVKMRIDTAKAFKSIHIDPSAMQRLAEQPKSRILIERFGIDPEKFTPVVAEEISIEQWIRLLQFYAKFCRYRPAKEILAKLRRIIKG